MINVLHLGGEAVLGRSPSEWYQGQFKIYGVNLIHQPLELQPIFRDGLIKNVNAFVEYLNNRHIDWVFFGWEMSDFIEHLWKHPNRQSKVLVYAQEQPQRLGDIERIRLFCDVLLTSAPTFQEKTDGYLPFPAHTAFMREHYAPWEEKKDMILISGSYRKCRYELFRKLLTRQPFRMPIYFLPSAMEWEPIGRHEYRSLINEFREWVVDVPYKFSDYIPLLLKHLRRTKMFIDMTFNPYPALHLSQGHAPLEDVFSIAEEYKGGYMPERVLDAAYLQNIPVCFRNPAIEYCLGDKPIYYSSYESLVYNVKEILAEKDSFLERLSQIVCNKAKQFSTERVINRLADIFITDQSLGKLPGDFFGNHAWRYGG